uniref:Uncharacterized protein n=1 Tax=Auxenochlorella protothecoides TaxID=3075 RepID=A0A1D2A1Z5_AUXPR
MLQEFLGLPCGISGTPGPRMSAAQGRCQSPPSLGSSQPLPEMITRKIDSLSANTQALLRGQNEMRSANAEIRAALADLNRIFTIRYADIPKLTDRLDSALKRVTDQNAIVKREKVLEFLWPFWMKHGPLLTTQLVQTDACATLLPVNPTIAQMTKLREQISLIIRRDFRLSFRETTEQFVVRILKDAVHVHQEDVGDIETVPIVLKKDTLHVPQGVISQLQRGPVWRTGDLVEEDEYGCLQFREFLCANKYFHHGLKRADDPDRIATIPLAFLAWIEMLVEGHIFNLGLEARVEQRWNQEIVDRKMREIRARPESIYLVPYELCSPPGLED